jgi:hypothetical protein
MNHSKHGTTKQSSSTEPSTEPSTDTPTYILTTTFLNPNAVIAILIVLFVIGIALYMNSSSSSNSDPYGSNYGDNTGSTISTVLGIIVAILFIIISVASVAQYVLKVDVVTNLTKLFSDAPEINVTVKKRSSSSSKAIPELKISEEVFNIPGNYFAYDDAKAMCNAYDSRLATYKEVEQSYNSGAEWCNYGWTDGQMALYPTQQTTWDGLQKIEGHENDCGRPGVNGGYMQNPNTKFGVNCFGYKPKMTSVEEDIMANTTPYPKTKKDIAMEKRVEHWKTRLDDLLVSPFNYKSWSKL